ncbi:hypothetical protein SOV_22190 [Sporomusa ovata DSM 2662]|uniref:Uncharacterized protein n=1 Tax=Sporomusa ovata TaxID=2378 RepID=A0A0U1L366_9FIRM|nr:hypothetical protein [Sporomusa ovata]EQB25536.1 hypothetical protein SOV_4c01980 [Sporomusa ovata DSM 2662]CQR74100.1 hypothetical protein SpAn4DRAFT_0562 [Sporomusa ovata]
MLITATGLGFLVSLLILMLDGVIPAFHPKMFLGVVICATLFFAILSMQEYKKLRIAELIIENQILHIQSAIIGAGVCGPDGASSTGGIEVFISCFGILLDSKIIKFNLDGIYLKGVEIGREYMCLIYGTKFSTQKTRILYMAPDSRELKRIVEKFRYETGVVPVITD